MGSLPEEADRGEPPSVAAPEGNAGGLFAPLAPPGGRGRQLLLGVGGAEPSSRCLWCDGCLQARQVLGDHFCRREFPDASPAWAASGPRRDASCVPASPSEEKCPAPPRLDQLPSFPRGRRQSGETHAPRPPSHAGVHPQLKAVPLCAEPPELLTFTPEKSRKSLPLLLEGNLPGRRARRQSGEVPLPRPPL